MSELYRYNCIVVLHLANNYIVHHVTCFSMNSLIHKRLLFILDSVHLTTQWEKKDLQKWENDNNNNKFNKTAADIVLAIA